MKMNDKWKFLNHFFNSRKLSQIIVIEVTALRTYAFRKIFHNVDRLLVRKKSWLIDDLSIMVQLSWNDADCNESSSENVAILAVAK